METIINGKEADTKEGIEAGRLPIMPGQRACGDGGQIKHLIALASGEDLLSGLAWLQVKSPGGCCGVITGVSRCAIVARLEQAGWVLK